MLSQWYVKQNMGRYANQQVGKVLRKGQFHGRQKSQMAYYRWTSIPRRRNPHPVGKWSSTLALRLLPRKLHDFPNRFLVLIISQISAKLIMPNNSITMAFCYQCFKIIPSFILLKWLGFVFGLQMSIGYPCLFFVCISSGKVHHQPLQAAAISYLWELF